MKSNWVICPVLAALFSLHQLSAQPRLLQTYTRDNIVFTLVSTDKLYSPNDTAIFVLSIFNEGSSIVFVHGNQFKYAFTLVRDCDLIVDLNYTWLYDLGHVQYIALRRLEPNKSIVDTFRIMPILNANCQNSSTSPLGGYEVGDEIKAIQFGLAYLPAYNDSDSLVVTPNQDEIEWMHGQTRNLYRVNRGLALESALRKLVFGTISVRVGRQKK